jgi:enediyne biosynthesis protein E4
MTSSLNGSIPAGIVFAVRRIVNASRNEFRSDSGDFFAFSSPVGCNRLDENLLQRNAQMVRWFAFAACCCTSFAARGADFPIVFEDATEAAGLREPLAGMMGHGGAVGDFDGDGHLDLFVGGFADRSDAEYAPRVKPPHNLLLRNRGNGTFVVVDQPAVQTFARTSGALFADLDNNGTLELFVSNNTRARTRRTEEPQRSAQLQLSQLFRNDNGRLIDVTQASGVCPPELQSLRNVGVFDYDGDGLLDLFLVEDRFRPGTSRSTLFRNEGNLKFRDVTAEAGLPEGVFGLGLAVADLNGDRRPDFFVPHSNRFFLSRGDGTYHEPESLRKFFAWEPLHREDWPCGAAFGDLNGNGLLDLVVSIHCTTARNKVYLNRGLRNGIPVFEDVTEAAGLGDVIPARCPHVEIQDFDNDGKPDIYLSAAWKDESGNIVPLIYRQVGTSAEGIPRFEPPRPIEEGMVYFPAGPSGDFNNDGRLDLFLINWFEENHSRLLINQSNPENHWLRVKPVGKINNRMGIGSLVKVYSAGGLNDSGKLLGTQEVTTGYGYASGQAAIPHFGLGSRERVDVSVSFPNGMSVELRNVEAGQELTVEEPNE